MSAKASYPEWMLFYLRAQAQGAFGGPVNRHRSFAPGEPRPATPSRA